MSVPSPNELTNGPRQSAQRVSVPIGNDAVVLDPSVCAGDHGPDSDDFTSARVNRPPDMGALTV